MVSVAKSTLQNVHTHMLCTCAPVVLTVASEDTVHILIMGAGMRFITNRNDKTHTHKNTHTDICRRMDGYAQERVCNCAWSTNG